jgi:hypothetical protein
MTHIIMPPISHEPPNSASSSNWHTIRPWSSRLSLVVREITSVSATFILTSRPVDSPEELAALGLDDPELFDDHDTLHSTDLLGRELAVKVNGAAWEKILVDVVEEGEEAIIVLYGLMPGRHYEVEINVISGKDQPIRKHVVTDLESSKFSSQSTTSRCLSHHQRKPAPSQSTPQNYREQCTTTIPHHQFPSHCL